MSFLGRIARGQEFLFLEPMRVFIVCILHAEELLDIGVNGFLVIISMVKNDGQHELQDLQVISEYGNVFEAFRRAVTSQRRRSYD